MGYKRIFFVFSSAILFFVAQAQKIPYGMSSDTFKVVIFNSDSFVNNMTYDDHPLMDTVQARVKVYYYKPINYDSAQSPFLIGIHGQYGTGSGAIYDLQAIADRRGTLIIAPVMPQNSEPNFWSDIFGATQMAFGYAQKKNWVNCIGYLSAYYGFWWPPVMKQIYRHTLIREDRNSASTYLTGFSMGGQFTSRYILIRQAIPDSIPIINTVSANPFFYTFCTDTFSGIPMYYSCGILQEPLSCNGCACTTDTICCSYVDTSYNRIPITCNEHVIQYYNENYGVLIGTADTDSNGAGCALIQGANRYERAKNFYNFSDTNAITRGTTLKWAYDSVPGVAHDGYAMYNTKRNVTDSSTIAESLLFDTPWHPVPQLAPVAGFTADTTIVFLPNATVQFFNTSIKAASFLWDFGDSTNIAAISPKHTYTRPDTFTVTLTALSTSGCENVMMKKNYIIVKDGVGVKELARDRGYLLIYPNPAGDNVTFSFEVSSEAFVSLDIYNYMGQKISVLFNSNTAAQQLYTVNFNTSVLREGIYFVVLETDGKRIIKKLMIIK